MSIMFNEIYIYIYIIIIIIIITIIIIIIILFLFHASNKYQDMMSSCVREWI